MVVTALTTPTWLITAQPDGGYSLSGNPQPVRAQQGKTWVPVSTILHKNTNGRLSPVATAYGSETFSAGGSGPLVTTTTASGGSYELSWPTTLPTPRISGSTATYANVLNGVDLQLTADSSGGFSEVLVVHNAQAAANPKLSTLTLAAQSSGGANARTGTLATARDGLTLQASSGLEWDSNTTPNTSTGVKGSKSATGSSAAGSASPAQIAAADPSTASAPGLAARTAPISVGIGARALTLRPDHGLLSAKNTAWPVYIDPTFSWHPASGGTPAYDEIKQDGPCNGVSYYNNSSSNADYGQLGAGYVPSSYASTCQGIQRALYQWKLPSVIDGGHINTATVGVAEVWQASFNCSQSRTVNLHWSGGISSGTDWNNRPGYLTGSDSYDGSTSIGASWNPECTGNGNAYAGFNVQGPIQTSANSSSSQITFALTDDAEESAETITNFARFSDNPTLNIEYGHAPNTPAASQLSASVNSDVADCATGAPYPYIGKSIVGSPVNLKAVGITSRDGDQLQATFKYWLTATPGTTYTGTSADNLANGGTAQYSLPSSFTSALTDGQNVSWQVQTSNGEWPSGWSSVCTFTAEPTAPDDPTIVANATYPNTDNGGTAGAAAGTPAVFQIAGNTSSATATKFYYNLDQPPASSGVPASEIALPIGTTSGTPTHRWLLTDGSGTTGADSGGTGGYPVALQTGVGWTQDTTRQTVENFNGTSGFAISASGANPITAGQNFTLSSWIKPTTLGGYALSLNGTTYSGLRIGTTTGGAWTAGLDANGTTTSSYTTATGGTATANLWALVTVTYTTSSGALVLYVNGTQVASVTDTAPPAQMGRLLMGADQVAGVASNFLAGDLSDTQTYGTALTAANVSAMYSTNNAALTITPLAVGPHTLYVEAVDAAGDVSGTSSYPFIAVGHANTTCTSLAACFNNTAISSNSAMSAGNADGAGNSISATDLANAGWASGGKVTIDGTSLTLPAFGSGQADNVQAENQTVDYNYAAPSTGSSSLMLLATATYGSFQNAANIAGNTTAPYVPGGIDVAGNYCFSGTNTINYCAPEGTITYAPGCNSASGTTAQSYFLTVPDWGAGPSSLAAVVLPHENTASGTQSTTTQPKLYPFSVPLYPGCTVQSVTLPDDSFLGSDFGTKAGHTSAIHVFAMGARDTTTGTVEANGTTAATPTYTSGGAALPYTWTGAWASDNEGNYDFESGNFNDQSFRVLVQPSVTGGTVRIKLDNALGTSPMDIGHATIAPTSGNDITPTAATTSAPVNLTFSGSQSTVIPIGAMTYSDPLSFPVTAGAWYAVSFELTNSVPDMVQHSWATDSYEYVAPIGSGDHTADSAATEFTTSGSLNGTYTDLVTGLDVQTEDIPTQVVLGDNLIDAWQPDTAPLSPNDGGAMRLSDDLADASATTPDPYGTVNAGIESNQLSVDNPESTTGGAAGGPAALSRIDRDVLDEPNIDTVVLNEGLEDALAGQTYDNLEAAYADLLTITTNTQTGTGGSSLINTVALGITPCGGYNGDGDTGTGTNANDPCSTNVETVRTTVNNDLAQGLSLGLNPWYPSTYYYIDPDAVIGVPTDTPVQLAPQAMVGTSRNNTPSDPVNLTNAGTGALANAVLAAQDTWALDDGNSSTTATDQALNNSSNAYLDMTDQNAGDNDLNLNGTYTWNTSTVGTETGQTVLGLDGTTAYGQSVNDGYLNTAGSFSISAWANLSSVPTGYATVASEAGAQASGFYLEYSPTSNAWCMSFMQSDTANAPGYASVPCAKTAPTANTWYHLVGTYNAATHTAQLYINGSLVATSTGIANWAASGTMLVGAGQYNDYIGDLFPGDISNVQAFNYTLTASQVSALYDQIQ